MSLPKGFRPILAGVATLVLVAACGQSGNASPSAAATATSAPSAAASASASLGPGEAYEIDTASDATIGTYLVGENGKTLYVFGLDSPGKATCNTTCAANWPPLIIQSNDTYKAGAGVTGTLTTIKRDDGSMQLAINGSPLYYFAGDTAKGQLNGQGIGGKWYAAGVDGSPNTGTAAAGSGAPAGSAAPGKTPCTPGYYHSCP
jgi:predicted lipoprotein with Yx(FWY)xxD motif